jgi:multidrug efflux pump subunit AcrB
VHDGWAVQQNIVRNEGRRSVLLSVLKNGNASTVAVVNGVRKVLEIARKAAPRASASNELFDQSKLVRASIAGVLREGAIAAGLTGLMILLFLGSWRSTLIVLISIPLSIRDGLLSPP